MRNDQNEQTFEIASSRLFNFCVVVVVVRPMEFNGGQNRKDIKIQRILRPALCQMTNNIHCAMAGIVVDVMRPFLGCFR